MCCERSVKSMMCCSRVMCCARCVVVALSESRDVFLRIVFEAEALRAWDAAGLCPAPNAAEIVTPRDDAPAEGVNAEEKKQTLPDDVPAEVVNEELFGASPSVPAVSASRLSGKQPSAVAPGICRFVSTLELTSLKRITKKL